MQDSLFWKSCRPVLESLFNNVAGLKTSNVIKKKFQLTPAELLKRLQVSCFHVFAKVIHLKNKHLRAITSEFMILPKSSGLQLYWTQVFPCEICEIFKNTCFEEYLWPTTASEFEIRGRTLRFLHFLPEIERKQKKLQISLKHFLEKCYRKDLPVNLDSLKYILNWLVNTYESPYNQNHSKAITPWSWGLNGSS